MYVFLFLSSTHSKLTRKTREQFRRSHNNLNTNAVRPALCVRLFAHAVAETMGTHNTQLTQKTSSSTAAIPLHFFCLSKRTPRGHTTIPSTHTQNRSMKLPRETCRHCVRVVFHIAKWFTERVQCNAASSRYYFVCMQFRILRIVCCTPSQSVCHITAGRVGRETHMHFVSATMRGARFVCV